MQYHSSQGLGSIQPLTNTDDQVYQKKLNKMLP